MILIMTDQSHNNKDRRARDLVHEYLDTTPNRSSNKQLLLWKISSVHQGLFFVDLSKKLNHLLPDYDKQVVDMYSNSWWNLDYLFDKNQMTPLNSSVCNEKNTTKDSKAKQLTKPWPTSPKLISFIMRALCCNITWLFRR